MKLCTVCNNHFDDGLDVCPHDYVQLVYIGKKPLVGSQVGGRYKVISAVGAGSMGVVYRATQLSTAREMAIKVLHGTEGGPGSAHVRRFRREAKAVSALNHENIVRLFDFGFMDDGQPYIVTDFIEGKTLAQLLRERGRLSIEEATPLLKQVCSAVQEAHRLKIVHRDLKPENIILQTPGQSRKGGKSGSKDYLVKVVDFGVAKLSSDANSSSASLTVEGKVCGSPGYMSPEQCKGLPVDVRSDIYSLGIVIFELLTGQRPFSADSVMGLLFMHVNEKPPTMNAFCLDLSVPFELEQVVQKSLGKNPEDRQRSVAELWQEFEAACAIKVRVPQQVVSREEAGSQWIRFNGIENRYLQEEARKLAEERDGDARLPMARQALLSHSSSEDSPVFRTRKKVFLSKPIVISLSIVLIVGLVVGVECQWITFPFADPFAEVPLEDQIDTMIRTGQLFDALRIAENLKKQMRAYHQDTEPLNERYLKIGTAFGQKKDWQNAMESLLRIEAKSKYYQKGFLLYTQYRKRAAS
jgi:serine/threonine-protein kinase